MKIILLQDIPKVGRKHDVKNVSDGYGRNFLIRKGLAELATDRSLASAEELKKRMAAGMAHQAEEIGKNLDKLSGLILTLKRKANDDGALFTGIKPAEIAEAIESQTGLAVAAGQIKLEKPIKTAGEYQIEVAAGERSVRIKLNVLRE